MRLSIAVEELDRLFRLKQINLAEYDRRRLAELVKQHESFPWFAKGANRVQAEGMLAGKRVDDNSNPRARANFFFFIFRVFRFACACIARSVRTYATRIHNCVRVCYRAHTHSATERYSDFVKEKSQERF